MGLSRRSFPLARVPRRPRRGPSRDIFPRFYCIVIAELSRAPTRMELYSPAGYQSEYSFPVPPSSSARPRFARRVSRERSSTKRRRSTRPRSVSISPASQPARGKWNPAAPFDVEFSGTDRRGFPANGSERASRISISTRRRSPAFVSFRSSRSGMENMWVSANNRATRQRRGIDRGRYLRARSGSPENRSGTHRRELHFFPLPPCSRDSFSFSRARWRTY